MRLCACVCDFTCEYLCVFVQVSELSCACMGACVFMLRACMRAFVHT